MAGVARRRQNEPVSAERMATRVERADQCLVVHVAGEIDYSSADGLREQVIEAAQAAGSWRLVIDLGDVGFCDSSGLGVLVGMWKTARAEGGNMVLALVPEACSRLLRRTGLDGFLGMCDTLSEAVSRVSA